MRFDVAFFFPVAVVDVDVDVVFFVYALVASLPRWRGVEGIAFVLASAKNHSQYIRVVVQAVAFGVVFSVVAIL